jgi:abortive infection bacteriophage resistance protein
MNKPAYPITDQIALLKQRGMIFKDEIHAQERLQNIGYHRLKGYWWDEQRDRTRHLFHPGTCFENILERYDFDYQLRLILFAGIARIEIALRSKMIYYLSLAYGSLWYLDPHLFETSVKIKNGVSKTTHLHTLDDLNRELQRSQESFIREHFRRNPTEAADAWIILEIASLGTLSKLYKSLRTNLAERALIAGELGVISPSLFTGWLEAITPVRNTIAHHARLWSRTILIRPGMQLSNPDKPWFNKPLKRAQLGKPFSVISCMVYLCAHLDKSESMKHQILSLIRDHPDVPIYKYGFFNDWESEPLWS